MRARYPLASKPWRDLLSPSVSGQSEHFPLATTWILPFLTVVSLYSCVTGPMQGHPLMPIIVIKALYICLSNELLSN